MRFIKKLSGRIDTAESGRKGMADTYKNSLLDGADPFILLWKGKYYLYSTNAQDGFKVYVSETLSEWEEKGYCLKKGDAMGERGFWAPEILARNGKFYMVYVADEHLAVATADNPLGPFTQTEKKWLSERNAIDGHFFADDDGTVYLYYVRFDNGNVLYMSKMAEDLLSFDEADERFLLRAEQDWELKDCSVTEGPFVLKHKGKYYLTYSANHTRSPYYAIGCAISDSPYGPFVKCKNNPVMQKNEFVNGVGHHSFFRAKNGELVCVYHCHCSKAEFAPRRVCIDRAEFTGETDENEGDALVIHGPTVTEQKAFG